MVAGDDRVIGVALRWSAVAVVFIVAIVVTVILLQGKEEEAAPVVEKETVLPKVQKVDVTVPEVKFTDITASSGITFVHENGARGGKFLPETMGPGCAFFDYDGDGDADLLFVNSTVWPGDEPKGGPARSQLYRNDKGTFVDVSETSGLGITAYGMGAAIGDYDNDGDADVFFACVGKNRLFRNDGGKFAEVTDAAGVGGDDNEWSTSSVFFDADNDGDLDLFVCNYVRWSREIDEKVAFRLDGVGRSYGPPMSFEGTHPYFYRNHGGGKFVDETKEAGLLVLNEDTQLPVAKALGVLPVDVNLDGWMDLFVANDTVRNFFYLSDGDGTFTETAETNGLAYDGAGKATGAMGVDAANFRGDECLAIGVGNFANEASSFYVCEDKEFFTDSASTSGVGPVSRLMLSFGLFFFDYDLDGRQDLFQANGHLEEEINKVQASQHYRQPSQLFWNSGKANQSFVPVDEASTGDLSRPVVGRAAAYADVDLDGDLDIVITQAGDKPLLLRNDQSLGNHWVRLRLQGSKSNRDAIGARVELVAGGKTQRQQVMPARSYLSYVEKTLSFGLGQHTKIDVVRVYWPGKTEPQVVRGLAVDQEHVVVEAE